MIKLEEEQNKNNQTLKILTKEDQKINKISKQYIKITKLNLT